MSNQNTTNQRSQVDLDEIRWAELANLAEANNWLELALTHSLGPTRSESANSRSIQAEIGWSLLKMGHCWQISAWHSWFNWICQFLQIQVNPSQLPLELAKDQPDLTKQTRDQSADSDTYLPVPPTRLQIRKALRPLKRLKRGKEPFFGHKYLFTAPLISSLLFIKNQPQNQGKFLENCYVLRKSLKQLSFPNKRDSR